MYEEEIYFWKLFLEKVLEHLTLVTLTFDIEINRMDVWTKFEEGR